MDEISRKHAAGCVRAFLEGKQTINWVMSFIRGHQLPPATLEEILISAKPGADRARYDKLLSACREQRLL
jgi:hypothetical protein